MDLKRHYFGPTGVPTDEKGVPNLLEGPKTLQNPGINIEKPQIDKALPSRVASFVVKESILWLGFKRPSTYWG